MNLSELYKGCRSYRRFKQDPIPEELLYQMIDNARISSSAHNAQSIRYIIVSSKEMVAAMQPLVIFASSLPKEIGTPKEGEQPTAFVIVLETEDKGVLCDMDIGLAVDAMVMTAWEAGVGSCLLGKINIPKIQELCDVPTNQTIRLVVALGVPDHQSTLVDAKEDGLLKYYLDEDRNYYVPKRKFEEIVKFV